MGSGAGASESTGKTAEEIRELVSGFLGELPRMTTPEGLMELLSTHEAKRLRRIQKLAEYFFFTDGQDSVPDVLKPNHAFHRVALHAFSIERGSPLTEETELESVARDLGLTVTQLRNMMEGFALASVIDTSQEVFVNQMGDGAKARAAYAGAFLAILGTRGTGPMKHSAEMMSVLEEWESLLAVAGQVAKQARIELPGDAARKLKAMSYSLAEIAKRYQAEAKKVVGRSPYKQKLSTTDERNIRAFWLHKAHKWTYRSILTECFGGPEFANPTDPDKIARTRIEEVGAMLSEAKLEDNGVASAMPMCLFSNTAALFFSRANPVRFPSTSRGE